MDRWPHAARQLPGQQPAALGQEQVEGSKMYFVTVKWDIL